MDFVSPSESTPIPSFILRISESFSQMARSFLPIEVELRNVSVLRSGVKLNYVTWGCCQNTGLFSVLNHETTSGNLTSRYLKLKTPVPDVCFTKEGWPRMLCLPHSFPGNLNTVLPTKKAGEKPRPNPLYLQLSGIHTLAEGRLSDQRPQHLPHRLLCVPHLLFFSLQCPPGYTTERGIISGQPVTGRVREGAVSNYHRMLL